ncbi:serine-type endopeptidase [Aureococcus anophagefferens]|nr:serine-type endopeptidase [Aureococcus anophagefferens]
MVRALVAAALCAVAGALVAPKTLAPMKIPGRAGVPRSSVVMMPIGVPKVAYRVPGAPSADWIDIYNRLYRERIIFLGQEIGASSRTRSSASCSTDSEDSTKPIYLYINCPGGSVIAGLAIFDTMNHIKSKVIIRIKENLVKLYAMMTGQTQDQIFLDLDRDNFMSAQEACDYGIIDKVIPVSD